MIQISKSNNEIRSVEDWFRFAPPKKGQLQWKDGRSAKELAKAWFPAPGEPQVPGELTALTESCSATAGVTWQRGEPERVTTFDDCGGEGRNADLVLWGLLAGQKVVASIEAKADEEFGEIAGKYADKCANADRPSRVPDRLELLCKGLLNVSRYDAVAGRLRYQLLTGLAGALVEASNHDASIAMFIVHEFLGVTDPEKVRANEEDLRNFVSTLSKGSITSISAGQLVGPFSVPGNQFFDCTSPIYIGKCRRTIGPAA